MASCTIAVYLLFVLAISSHGKHLDFEKSSTSVYYEPVQETNTISSEVRKVEENGNWTPEETSNAIKSNESILDEITQESLLEDKRESSTSDDVTETTSDFSAAPENSGFNDTRSLKRVFLSNRSIVCNDGSQAGFYLRKSLHGNPVWIVFLEGGWYCYDHHSCRNRWMRLRHLMTSSQWPETQDLNGVLSGSSAENPYWYSANHVTVPYCSSDSWSGTAASSVRRDGFHFMGKLIVNQVIRDLVPLGLSNATQLILAGTSAGGTGVMINLDPIQHLLHVELGLKHIAVRGISDSGWFLDRTPYSPNTLPAVDAIKKGYALWQGSLPKKCVDIYPQEPWRCFFGYRLYPTLRAPLFVFQFLFDEAQMTADNVGAPSTPQQWDYIHTMGRALRDSFTDVSAVFAPSCVSHSILTKKDWLKVRIDGVSVAKALRCWELATSRNRRRNTGNVNPNSRPLKKMVKAGSDSIHNPNKRRKRKKLPNDEHIINAEHIGHSNRSVRNKEKHHTSLSRNRQRSNKNKSQNENRNKSRHRNRRPHVTQDCYNRVVLTGPNDKRFRCNSHIPNRRHNKSRHHRLNSTQILIHNDTNDYSINRKSVAELVQKPKSERLQRSLSRNVGSNDCEHRHIERCSWPQCSHSCPRLLDPYTGEEVHFIDMLKSFGLQMDSVAKALGVDIHTLNNMEHSELLNLLTQQIN